MIEEIFNDCNSVEHGGNIYRLAEELKIQEKCSKNGVDY